MTHPGMTRVVLVTALVWSVGLFVLGLLIRLAINQINIAVNYSLDPFMGGVIHSMFIGLAVGAGLGSYTAARQLRRFPRLSTLRPPVVAGIWAGAMLLYPFLFFALANLFMPPPMDPVPLTEGAAQSEIAPYVPPFFLMFARDMIIWAIPGLLGGLLTALVINRSLKIGGGGFAWITLGWGLGFGLGGGLSGTLVNLTMWVFSMRIGIALTWLENEIAMWLGFAMVALIGSAIGMWLTAETVRDAARTAPLVFNHAPAAK